MKFIALVLSLLTSWIIQAETDKLTIHYINVGQGGATLIEGPNATILYDFGGRKGDQLLVPYLKNLGYGATKPIQYSILSHRHKDHHYGYKDLINAEIDISVANYTLSEEINGVQITAQYATPALKTTAGKVRSIPVGLVIALGNNVEVYVVASDGRLMDGSKVAVSNENDRSVVLFVNYKNFQYLIDGDLGGGKEQCSNRVTEQEDVQSKVADVLLAKQLISEEEGVDVLHISHHGSESSTSSSYIDKMKPEWAIISVGAPNKRYLHPRKSVVENVLLGKNADQCNQKHILKAENILQTDEGDLCSNNSPHCTSVAGQVMGDVVISTDGNSITIEGSGLTRNKTGKYTIQPVIDDVEVMTDEHF